MGRVKTKKKTKRKLKRTSKSSSRKTMDISVLSYNVCWECMSGTAAPTKAKEYGQKCGAKINKCRSNVIDICTSNPYSFIALQEAELDLVNDIIEQLKKKRLGNYSKVFKTMGLAKAVIIYNSTLFKKSSKQKYGNIIEKGRPYLIQGFIHKETDQSVIVGSFHGPHSKENWVNEYIKIALTLKGRNDRMIIMGDFNREIKRDININGNKFKVLNKGKIKTGWNLNGKSEKYTQGVDNIIVSDNINVVFGPETVGDKQNVLLPRNTRKKYTSMASDHKPLAAILSI